MNERDVVYEASKALKEGKVLLCPSDTIWGISADATNEKAVQKIIDLKGRDQSKSFIVLLHSDRLLNQCYKDIPEIVWDLVDYADQPLTVVLNDGRYVAPNAINANGSLGFRMVKSGSCFEILKAFNKPIISTSANFSNQPSPKSFEEIDKTLINLMGYTYPKQMAKGMSGKASKIISISRNGEVKILRK